MARETVQPHPSVLADSPGAGKCDGGFSSVLQHSHNFPEAKPREMKGTALPPSSPPPTIDSTHNLLIELAICGTAGLSNYGGEDLAVNPRRGKHEVSLPPLKLGTGTALLARPRGPTRTQARSSRWVMGMRSASTVADDLPLGPQ